MNALARSSLLLALLSRVALAGDPPPVVIPTGKLGPSGAGWTTSKFGDGFITRGANGQSYTTSKFGDGWITRGPSGQTWTTSKFGDGSISRTTGTGNRTGVLVLPAPKR